MRNSYGFSSLAIALAALAASPALAEDEYNVTTGYTLDGAGLGVHGVDPVVLSTLNAVAPGDAANAVVHDGVAYYFASKLSAERFQADPDRYLPQYGGDPRYADIVDGKLYLFVNAAVYARYLADKENTLRTADEKWPQIHHTPVDQL